MEGKDLEPYLTTLKAEEDTAPGAEFVTCHIALLARCCSESH